jgi:hypothetical protein
MLILYLHSGVARIRKFVIDKHYFRIVLIRVAVTIYGIYHPSEAYFALDNVYEGTSEVLWHGTRASHVE